MSEPKRSHKKKFTPKPVIGWGKPKGPIGPVVSMNNQSVESSDRRVMANTRSFQQHEAFIKALDERIAAMK